MSDTPQKIEHTPLPWMSISGGSPDWPGAKIGLEHEPLTMIADSMLPRDADFAVLACNCHYDLLSALEYVDSIAPIQNQDSAWEPGDLITVTLTVQGLRDIRAAIAAATP